MKPCKIDVNINKVCTKVLQSIGIIRRLFDMVSDSVLHSLYYAPVCPRLTSEISAWGFVYPSALKCLKYLVRKAITKQNISLKRPDRSFL